MQAGSGTLRLSPADQSHSIGRPVCLCTQAARSLAGPCTTSKCEIWRARPAPSRPRTSHTTPCALRRHPPQADGCGHRASRAPHPPAPLAPRLLHSRCDSATSESASRARPAALGGNNPVAAGLPSGRGATHDSSSSNVSSSAVTVAHRSRRAHSAHLRAARPLPGRRARCSARPAVARHKARQPGGRAWRSGW